VFARAAQILARTWQPFTQANSLPTLSHNLTFIFAYFPNQKCEILHCYYTHFIFITHVVRRSSIFLSRCVNFCILIHKFSHRCTHCHHTHFIFITKQSILASFITRMVAKTILHTRYFVNLQTFLSSTINFLSTSMAHHYFLL